MMLTLWIFFVVVAVALFTIGYYVKNDLLRILAVIFFFCTGLSLETEGLNYVSGAVTNITSNYSSIVNTYATYNSHLFAFYMMIVAAFTLVYIMFERRHPNT